MAVLSVRYRKPGRIPDAEILRIATERSVAAAALAAGLNYATVRDRLDRMGWESGRRAWTVKEVALLRAEYEAHAAVGRVAVLARRLGRPPRRVREQARRLGLTRADRHRTIKRRPDLTPERVVAAWRTHGYLAETAEALGTTIETVVQRLRRAGVDIRATAKRPRYRAKPRPSLPDLIDLYERLGSQEAAGRLGVCRSTLITWLRRGGYRFFHGWTPEQIATLRAEYVRHARTATLQRLADRLGVRKAVMVSKAQRLGLTDWENVRACLRARARVCCMSREAKHEVDDRALTASGVGTDGDGVGAGRHYG